MPPEPGRPAEWLEFAEGDLILAKSAAIQGVPLELLCSHAQQAAEKAIKGVLSHEGVDFPRTHAIELLVGRLPPGLRRACELRDAHELTPYAGVARYPAASGRVSQQDYLRAVSLAEGVVAWARQHI